MLDFLKTPFLLLHFSCYKLMTLLMMLSVLLLSMLMIVLSKCNQASDLSEQLDLAAELESDIWDTVDTVDREKLSLFYVTGIITLLPLIWKWMGLYKENHLLRSRGCLSLLNWGSYIISIAKTVCKKIRALICSVDFLSSEFALYLYKCTKWPPMECCWCS